MSWTPEPVETADVVAEGPVRALAGLLDIDPPGAELPPLWHWLFHLERHPQAALGPDGHPRDGRFLPPLPDRRRMFAGARYTAHAPIRLGDELVKRSELTSVKEKDGRTGKLLFTTVRHRLLRAGELLAEEEQDIVYRSGDAPASPEPPIRPDGKGLRRTDERTFALSADPALLFRFSALTYNAHRIHYDFAYATEVEGHRGLVVHGPLLAILMAELGRTPQGGPTSLSFTLRRPVFAGTDASVERTGDGAKVTNGAGETAAVMAFTSAV
ncbi:MaoC family dehydratase N-terminal domain-containing protein [Actinocorallia sp. A-T 12471]|uniref:FAS1-like dehydratase domain-containing protein n=1 Tax=Actinocorallia sp. A-T 12471 TaxID=3089813 RepID=UPI0029CF24A6|nr:MaoC family dehydratase N-terminal domain-containing protein [Actinocorallia sp. A-T 12471]MDX6739397.1 MaoC family dehydratase N-terminal domain-containing protein [Actinocorallia sp. A-T 12471]